MVIERRFAGGTGQSSSTSISNGQVSLFINSTRNTCSYMQLSVYDYEEEGPIFCQPTEQLTKQVWLWTTNW